MNTDKRFLNYKKYDNFQRDLTNGDIPEDTIVFIQDPNKRCIWARGVEYAGSLSSEEFNQFKTIYLAFVQATTNAVNGIDGRVTSLENVIEEDHDGVINKFNEIVNFLNQIPNSDGDPNLKQLLADIASTIPDVSNKADKSEIPTVPTNVSAFTNDSGYLVEADIANKANSADLATVAISGDYDDLINTPTIPAAQVQSDWVETDTGEPSFIKNKPTNVSAFINDAGYLTSADIEGVGDVDERQLNAKLKTLQEYFADQYVLKKDVQTPETNVWSEATIYPFGELPESEIGETPIHTSIEAYREDVYNQLERDGAIRNDICYLIYK